MAVERMRNSTNVNELARELGVNRSLMYRWRGQLEATPANETGNGQVPENPQAAKLREENGVLKRALAEKRLEVDFLKGALQKVEALRQRNRALARRHLGRDPGSDADARQPEYRADVPAGRVSRAGFYRSLSRRCPHEEEMEVRDAIQKDRA